MQQRWDPVIHLPVSDRNLPISSKSQVTVEENQAKSNHVAATFQANRVIALFKEVVSQLIQSCSVTTNIGVIY